MKTLNLFNQNLAEISVRYSHPVPARERIKISSSRDLFDQLTNIFEDVMEHHERFVIVMLSRSNQILGYYKLSEGGLSGTVADPKMIFQVALKANASSIILSHNHPSGNPKPSEADISLTKKIKEAGSFLDLPILDHLIVTADYYFSFADEGLI